MLGCVLYRYLLVVVVKFSFLYCTTMRFGHTMLHHPSFHQLTFPISNIGSVSPSPTPIHSLPLWKAVSSFLRVTRLINVVDFDFCMVLKTPAQVRSLKGTKCSLQRAHTQVLPHRSLCASCWVP